MLHTLMITINTDDDFHVNFSGRYGKLIKYHDTVFIDKETLEEAVQAAITALQTATLPWVKGWSLISNGKTKNGDYAKAWEFIRDAAIMRLQEGDTKFSFGGNQTIEVDLHVTP